MEKGSLEKRDPKEKRPKGEDLKEKEARGERKHEEGSMSGEKACSLPVRTLARLVALGHVLQDGYHLLPKTFRLQHHQVASVP